MKYVKNTAENILEAVQLVQQSDISILQAARNLGINDNVLRHWRKDLVRPAKARADVFDCIKKVL